MNSTQQVATILHDAYFFDPKNWSPGMNYPNLPQIIDTIKRLFNQLNEQEIPYLLGSPVLKVISLSNQRIQPKFSPGNYQNVKSHRLAS